jgi:NAD(P)H-nitrite reductase large subunit
MRRYVIIGNGAAGITAAEELRRRDARASITIVTDERHAMYSRPGLAYVLIDEVSAQQAVARKPDWYARQRVDLIHSRADRIDFDARQVRLANGQSRPYDALLIAVGARAVPAPFPGGDLDGVAYLDDMDSTLDIIRRAKSARAAVVIGGGITALELAEGLAHHKVETHYFVRKHNLWSALLNDRESRLVEQQIRHHGVHIHYGTETAEIIGKNGSVTGVRTRQGEIIDCQIVGVAIGVRPNSTLAKDTPLAVDRGFLTDEYLQTNVPGVYAAGDCAQIFDVWSGEHRCDSLWPTAVASARAAAINMAGERRPYHKGTPFNAALLFGLHLTAIGQVAAAGRDDDEAEELSFISRGSSEVWTAKPGGGYTSAWADDGTSSKRLVVRGNTIVGALLLGNQRLADPLRDLIDKRVDISAVKSRLMAGGDVLTQAVLEAWQRSRSGRPAPGVIQPAP